MAFSWIFRAALAGLTLTSPPQPLFLSANTPLQLTLTVEQVGQDFLGPSTGFNGTVRCATDRVDPRAPRDVFFQQTITNITTSNVRQGQQFSFNIPGVAITDRYKQVFCDIITTANSGSGVQIAYGPNSDLGNAEQTWNPQLTWRVGPNLNGSSTSFLTSGSDDIQPFWGFDVESQRLQGARIEAWYRCDPIGPVRPDYNGDASATRDPLAGGDGVFYSNSKDDQTQLLSFSHNATQLCGLATRFNTTSNTFATFQACSQQFPSTSGQWVHGAMVFEMLPARFSFFINGVQIPTIPPAVTPPVATAGDGSFIPLENNYLLGGRGTSGAYYIRSGTSIDQIRLYPTTANFAADIAASWNKAAPNANIRNGSYAFFHHSGAQRELIWRQPDAQAAGRTFFSLQNATQAAAGPLPFLTQSTEPRSCNRAGCGEFGTTGFDGPAAAVTPPPPVSSSSSTGAGTNTTTTSSSSTGPASNSSTAPAAGASSSGAGFVTGGASVVSPAGVFMAAVATLASLAAMLL